MSPPVDQDQGDFSDWAAVRLTLFADGESAVGGKTEARQASPQVPPPSAVQALLETVAQDRESKRQTDWAERDLAHILTTLLGSLHARTRPGQCYHERTDGARGRTASGWFARKKLFDPR